MEEADPRELSDAIWTVPNLLTFVRLGVVPVFVWVALGPRRLDIALGLAVFGLITDLVDGHIARSTGQITKLGTRLDPLADRLGLASGAVVLFVHDALAPWWLVLAIVGRDVLLLAVGLPVLRVRKRPIPDVSLLGKRASFGISLTVGLMLATGWFDPDEPIRGVQIAAYVSAAAAIPAYWASGLGYAKAAFGPAGGR